MIAAGLYGYIIGSLPLGYLAGRRFGGVDLRAVGSRNVGATNMYRVSGPRLGLAVMAIDVAKGALAVVLVSLNTMADADLATAAVGAVTGHIYPVWLRGRGGKGVATACGAFGVLAPMATAGALLAFVLTVALTRVVSAGSVVASVSLPGLMAITDRPRPIVWASLAAAALVVWRHRGNLRRLWQGTERRLSARGGRGA
jgi:glycerol-3-phosphate acyltransferase PlsY